MNHSKIYADIINRAKERNNLEGYYETHHVIPRCLGGSDENDNLAKLTAKEHFICHALLCHIFPQSEKLLYAFHLMRTVKTDDQERYISGSNYKLLRERYSKSVSEQMRGNTYTLGMVHTEETREKMSKSQRAFNESDAGLIMRDKKRQLSLGNTNVQDSEYYKSGEMSRNLSEKMKGKKNRLGIPNTRHICQYCGSDTTSTGLTQFHGPNSTRSSSNCKSLALARNMAW